MGMHLYVQVIFGVSYQLRDYRVIGKKKAYWCEHRDVGKSKEKFCPECGARRPAKKQEEYEELDASKLPSFILEACSQEFTKRDYGSEEYPTLADFGVEDFLREVGTIELSEDISIWQDFHNEILFVGRILGEMGGYDSDDLLEFSLSDFPETGSFWGWGLEPKIIMHSYWA